MAAALDTVWHPGMQFDAIAGGSSQFGNGVPADGKELDNGTWQGSAPRVGMLDLEQLRKLGEVFGRHTSTPERIFLAIWEGWGLAHGASNMSSAIYLPEDMEVGIETSLHWDADRINPRPQPPPIGS